MGLKDKAKLTPSERWASSLSEMSESTKRTYTREFQEFLDWATETPTGLIGYWIETQDMSLNDHVREYMAVLTEQGHKGGKQSSAQKAIKKFFKVNGYAPSFDVKNMAGNGGVRIAKAEEIREVLRFSITNPRDTALISISKDSGLRVSDMVRIQFHHIQPIIDNPSMTFHGFQIPVHKTRNKHRQALPCLGPEAIYHLRAWLRKRKTLGLSQGPEDYVFVNTREVKEYSTNTQNRKESVIGSRLDDKNASVVIGKLFKRAGINDLSANSLRKYNTTALSMGGMGENLIKVMHGKHQQSSTDHYLKATAEQMLEVYQDHYQALSIEDSSPREIDQLRDEVKRLETEKNDEVQELKSLLMGVLNSPESLAETKRRLEKTNL